MDFNPPINTRSNEELVFIAHGTTNNWQQEAIDQAKAELIKRSISDEEQHQIVEKDAEENERLWQEELDRRKTEDFGIIYKILIVILWPMYLLRDWHLKRDGYELQAKRRIQLLILGFIWTALYFIWESIHPSHI